MKHIKLFTDVNPKVFEEIDFDDFDWLEEEPDYKIGDILICKKPTMFVNVNQKYKIIKIEYNDDLYIIQSISYDKKDIYFSKKLLDEYFENLEITPVNR